MLFAECLQCDGRSGFAVAEQRLSDWLFAARRAGHSSPFLLCATARLIAALGCGLGVWLQVFLWFYNGPSNALLANCVDARIRTRAFSISIFLGHALGDAISPALVGAISDGTGSLALGVRLLPALPATRTSFQY